MKKLIKMPSVENLTMTALLLWIVGVFIEEHVSWFYVWSVFWFVTAMFCAVIIMPGKMLINRLRSSE